MERLTHKARYEAGYKINRDVHVWQAADRLAAYEDTGLTPEEILDGKMLTGWIPVTERLPDDRVNVLISTKCGDVNTDFLSDGEWFFCDGNDYEIVAWMPLPESYQQN